METIGYSGYNVSIDYERLKKLLDDGYKVIGFSWYDNVKQVMTIQKAGPNWFDSVAYGFYGDDHVRNCYKSDDFIAFCKRYSIQYIPPKTRRKFKKRNRMGWWKRTGSRMDNENED